MKEKIFFTLIFSVVFGGVILFGSSALVVAAEDDPSVTVTSPNGGESYETGSTIEITWEQTNVDKVTIGYKTCPSCLNWIVTNMTVDINSDTGLYSWTIPSYLSAGDNYQIEIIAGHTGVGQDIDYSNGFFSISSGSQQNQSDKPDLIVDDIYLTPSDNPEKGKPYYGTINVKISNIGTAATDYNEGISVAVTTYDDETGAILGWICNTCFYNSGLKYVDNLAPGASDIVSYKQDGTIFDVKKLRVTARLDNAMETSSGTGFIDELNENNNISSTTFTLEGGGKPDLVIKDIYFSPSNPEKGVPFNGTVNVKISNIGESDADSEDGVRVSATPYNADSGVVLGWKCGTCDPLVESGLKKTPLLGAGETRTESFTLVNNTFDVNNLRVIAHADLGGGENGFIDESNETNNKLEKTFVLSTTESGQLGKPDLVVNSIFFSTVAPIKGKPFNGQLKVEVANNGNVATDYYEGVRVSIGLYNASNGAILPGGKLQYVSNLAPGGTSLPSILFDNIVFNVDTLLIRVWVDNAESSATGFIDESNEQNNGLEKTFTLASDTSEEAKLREHIRKLNYHISQLEQKVVELEKKLLKKIDKILTRRLNGRILLQVEEHGEAWYVDDTTEQKYYLKDGTTAYQALRAFGLGITNSDLAKIPVGFEDRFEDTDTDNDGLADKIEEALGTDPNNPDTDGDGNLDGEEVRGGYNPLGLGRSANDTSLANRLKGKVLLQVESRGEAWYIHPENGKRYYMKDGSAAYQIMRFLSIGITNNDLRKIDVGSFE